MAHRCYKKKQASQSTPSCRRFCTTVCNTLFLVGRKQCIKDCLNCRGSVGSSKSKSSGGKRKPKGKRKCYKKLPVC